LTKGGTWRSAAILARSVGYSAATFLVPVQVTITCEKKVLRLTAASAGQADDRLPCGECAW
jgi:hypothetical protein